MYFAFGPKSLARSLIRGRLIITTLVRRELIGKYKGSALGFAWSFFNPLFILAVYTFFFGVVFKSKWGGSAAGGILDFAVTLFAGLIVHAFFAECVNRAPMIIMANTNYVKKAIFPLEALPCALVGAAFIHFVISLAILLLAVLVERSALPLTVVYAVLIIAPFVAMTLGLSWFLAALGVYLRDVSQFIGMFTTAMLFLSPIFYPLDALPSQIQPYLYLNPLTLVVEDLRAAVIWGKHPGWEGLAIYYLASALVAFAGFAFFQKTRSGFADVV